LIALSDEHEMGGDYSGFATILRGWAIAAQGRHEEGIQLIKEGIATHATTGVKVVMVYFLSMLADACINAGRLDDARNALTPTLGPEMHRLKGELLRSQNHSNAAEAERSFRRAVEMARSTSAKSMELRATTSLARLLAKQGRRDEARAMLAEIYGWFTEGFDTADLKDAKALLDELDG
jgi:predicted ATPase